MEIGFRPERKAMDRVEFSNGISRRILEDFDLRGKKVLDAGSGDDPELGGFVANKEGIFIPLDIKSEVLDYLKPELKHFRGVQGDISELPFRTGEIDIANERFVIMHLRPEMKEEAVREMLRVAKEAAIFMEYDATSYSSDSDPEEIKEFMEIGRAILAAQGSDPAFGAHLGELFKEMGIEAEFETHARPEDDYTDELLEMLDGMSRAAWIVDDGGRTQYRISDLSQKISLRRVRCQPYKLTTAVVRK